MQSCLWQIICQHFFWRFKTLKNKDFVKKEDDWMKRNTLQCGTKGYSDVQKSTPTSYFF
jgi:hypothetical protein